MVEIVFYAALGLIVGSFLNVVAVRFHDGRSVGGRSACVSCGNTLAWYDLAPVLSWLALRGKCRYCKESVSFLYPATELATALAFVALGTAHLPLFQTALALLIAALLIAIARYDLSHMLIPDAWVWIFNALALLAIIFNFQFSIFNFIAGPLIAAPFLGLWLVSRGAWMGLGDAKLALGIGWLLGFQGGLTALLVAFVSGAAVGLLLMGFSQWGKTSSGDASGYTMKSEIPFGPFLIASCFFVWITQMHGVFHVLPLMDLL